MSVKHAKQSTFERQFALHYHKSAQGPDVSNSYDSWTTPVCVSAVATGFHMWLRTQGV
jgi:hypothetical protein